MPAALSLCLFAEPGVRLVLREAGCSFASRYSSTKRTSSASKTWGPRQSLRASIWRRSPCGAALESTPGPRAPSRDLRRAASRRVRALPRAPPPSPAGAPCEAALESDPDLETLADRLRKPPSTPAATAAHERLPRTAAAALDEADVGSPARQTPEQQAASAQRQADGATRIMRRVERRKPARRAPRRQPRAPASPGTSTAGADRRPRRAPSSRRSRARPRHSWPPAGGRWRGPPPLPRLNEPHRPLVSPLAAAATSSHRRRSPRSAAAAPTPGDPGPEHVCGIV